MPRILAILILSTAALAAAPALVQEFCMDCHDSETAKAEIDVERMLTEQPLVRNRKAWARVIDQVAKGEMPPPKKPQPSSAQRREILAWLDQTVTQFDYDQVLNPGFEPARRLTHAEYAHSVRDLFGKAIDLEDRFAQDMSGTSGFHNSGNTLFLQHRTLESYVANAEYCVNAALADPGVQQRLIALPRRDAGADAEGFRRVLTPFLRRAWRRPARSEEINALVDHARNKQRAGQSFADACADAFMVALISPHFVMKTEAPVAVGTVQAISDWDFASRLSFFLWASPPDDRLLDLAESGALAEEAVLQAEVTRMLADTRAHSLGTQFAAQWLGFGALGSRIRLDPIDNPWCTQTLMAAMRAESALFVYGLFRQNRPLHEFVHADYSYLNEELARHYRLPGITGDHMRRVKLSTARRGGIVTQGSILAVTSYPDRTSPVLRGTWILTELLGTPPPPPPANAGDLDDVPEERRGRELSLRERLSIHRDNKKCASCHEQIDPLGFALENYDLFGRWRTRNEGRTIDPRGKLPDSDHFSGPIGLKRVLLQSRYGDLSQQITRRLLAYALGRQLEYYDERAIRQIHAEFAAADYRLKALVFAVINSYPFRNKQLQVEDE